MHKQENYYNIQNVHLQKYDLVYFIIIKIKYSFIYKGFVITEKLRSCPLKFENTTSFNEKNKYFWI